MLVSAVVSGKSKMLCTSCLAQTDCAGKNGARARLRLLVRRLQLQDQHGQGRGEGGRGEGGRCTVFFLNLEFSRCVVRSLRIQISFCTLLIEDLTSWILFISITEESVCVSKANKCSSHLYEMPLKAFSVNTFMEFSSSDRSVGCKSVGAFFRIFKKGKCQFLHFYFLIWSAILVGWRQ